MLSPTTPTAVLAVLAAGVVLLLYGVQLVTDAVQRAADARVHKSLMTLARYPLATFGVGVLATTLTQSSTATSTLLVRMVNAQLIPLTAAAMMLLGANVGSTLAVQLLALHITNYALELVGLGAAIALFTRHSNYRHLGRAPFAFGLIVLGLAALAMASQPIASNPLTTIVLKTLVGAPLVLLIIGALLAVVFTSSAASIGLVLVLASNGALPLVAALALTMGANIGTTLTALLTSLSGGSAVGRRLALLHTGTKLTGAMVVFALLNPLALLLIRTGLNPGTLVALTHLGFNLALAIVFGPFIRPLARLAVRLLPEQATTTTSGPRYLDPAALSTPAVALGHATREILRMTGLVTEMLNCSIHAFESAGSNIPPLIHALDDELDALEMAVKRYLTRLDEKGMTEEQRQREVAFLYIITDLEAIGDIIDKQMMHLARRKQQDQVVFSEEGWKDLVTYHHEVECALQQVLAALAAQDPALAAEFLAHKTHLTQIKRYLQLRHVHRLHEGMMPSIASSSIHLDLLNAMSRVLSHASNIAHVIHGDCEWSSDVNIPIPQVTARSVRKRG